MALKIQKQARDERMQEDHPTSVLAPYRHKLGFDVSLCVCTYILSYDLMLTTKCLDQCFTELIDCISRIDSNL